MAVSVQMVKIKTYKASATGRRGMTLTLPKVWIKDMDVQSGDTITVYRDTLDRLVIEKDGAK